jgi:hypothetical protein
MDTVKKVLKNSYKKKGKQKADINGYQRDDKLSGQRVQVYNNPESGHTFVAHRGTASGKDILNDLALSVGLLKKTDRFKHAKKIQKQAEAKYDNVTSVGHSLGGSITENVTKGDRITLNKGVGLADIGKKISKKQQDIRASSDLVSGLSITQHGNKPLILPSQSYNPLINHKVDILNKLIE